MKIFHGKCRLCSLVFFSKPNYDVHLKGHSQNPYPSPSSSIKNEAQENEFGVDCPTLSVSFPNTGSQTMGQGSFFNLLPPKLIIQIQPSFLHETQQNPFSSASDSKIKTEPQEPDRRRGEAQEICHEMHLPDKKPPAEIGTSVPIAKRAKLTDRAFPRKDQKRDHVFSRTNRARRTAVISFPKQCQICSQFFFKDYKYSLHLKSHERKKNLECRLCQRELSSKPRLNYHMQSRHGDAETKAKFRDSLYKFKCHICSATFPYMSKLRDHEFVHRNKKLFKCNQCDKLFQTPMYRYVHFKQFHNPNSQRTCYFCRKTFPFGSRLKTHLKLHFQEF